MRSGVQIRSGFRILILAAVVLCNPTVGFVDVLPNCIGYWMLCVGLNRLSDLNGRIAEAVRRFRILILLSIVQLLAAYFAYGVIAKQATNVYELRSFLALGSFLMLLAQWFFLIPAFRDLFLGLGYLAERHDSTMLLVEKRGKTDVQRIASLTRLFVVASSVFALLPELTGLSSLNGKGENGIPEYGMLWYDSVLSSPESAVDRYVYIDFLRLLATTASLIIALIWLISFVRFVLRILRDDRWIKRLEGIYQAEVLPQTGMLTVRCFSKFFYLLQIAFVFAAGVRMNDRAILPGFLFSIFATFAVLQLGKLASLRCGCYTVCGLLAITSIGQLVLNDRYLQRFTPKASLYQKEAYEMFCAVQVADIFEVVLKLLLIAVLFWMLCRIARDHTGVQYGDETSMSLSQSATQRLHKKFAVRLNTTLAVFVLAAVLSIAETLLRFRYEWLWLLSLSVSFVGVMMFYSFLYELKSEICFRYDSDGVNKNI
ncbi:MAG: hypothetical protein IJF33_04865 [Clostridia bacterium]|nr:hypothetical protein [Clostridia bacterium]